MDGGHGFDAIYGTNNPTDNDGHGTLVLGVVGGVGNNGKGVTGVAWRANDVMQMFEHWHGQRFQRHGLP